MRSEPQSENSHLILARPALRVCFSLSLTWQEEGGAKHGPARLCG
jgi:hypothetical protein